MKHSEPHKIKESMAKVVNNKSEADITAKGTEKSRKWCVKLHTLYSEHFPTDQNSYALYLPAISLVVSLCAIQIFFNIPWHQYVQRLIFFLWAIIVLISAVNYGLYHAIITGDRKQFTPWIIVKTMETIATALSLLNGLYCFIMYGDGLVNVIGSFGVIGANFFLLSSICQKRNAVPQVDEKVDKFSPVICSA